MKVQIHVFFTSAADGDACSVSAPDSFNFLYSLVRRQGGTRRGLNSKEERVNSVSALNFGFSSPWYSHCRDRPVCSLFLSKKPKTISKVRGFNTDLTAIYLSRNVTAGTSRQGFISQAMQTYLK